MLCKNLFPCESVGFFSNSAQFSRCSVPINIDTAATYLLYLHYDADMTLVLELNADFLRYEVRFQNGMDCGGAYMKLLSDSPSLNLVSIISHSLSLSLSSKSDA